MKEKGLCSTCVNNEKCCLSRSNPVLQCEEFSSYEPAKTRIVNAKQKKTKSGEEASVGEFIGE